MQLYQCMVMIGNRVGDNPICDCCEFTVNSDSGKTIEAHGRKIFICDDCRQDEKASPEEKAEKIADGDPKMKAYLLDHFSSLPT